MGGGCRDSQFWDPLLKNCEDCNSVCQQQRVTRKCVSYCESARCRALPAHYYDSLLKKCINCMTICGRHPADCSQHCRTLPPPTTTQRLRLQATPRAADPGGAAALGDPAAVLYSLLAVCMVLLFSSLSLALVVLMREKKAKAGKQAPAEGKRHEEKSVVLPRQEFGFSPVQQNNTKGYPTIPARPADRAPSDDSIPTETCVCVHCFPDLKTLGQAGDRPPRENASFYQPAVFHGARARDAGPLWSEGSPRHHATSGPKVQADAAVG